MSILAAIRFLTVLPVVQNREFSTEELGRSSAWFPLVGLMLGGVLVGMDFLLEDHLNGTVLNMLLIITMVMITGALHLDGFIDTCDGIFLRRPAEDRLRIMSDSRVGGFGVVGACCLILLKFAALLALPHDLRWGALLLMPLIGRWTMTCLLYLFPYARDEGKGLIFKQQVNGTRVIIATSITLLVSVVIGWTGGLLLLAATGLMVLLLASYINHGLGGLTGDTYGAANEIAEVVILILFPIVFDAIGGGVIA
ncbi:MAG: adenosylcobinamide-GDP ribazoletransferase [Chloroflexota bacterium]|nr:adenosylcobinamide-GDP ribazoletransferase [Chloroflexota bacterium]